MITRDELFEGDHAESLLDLVHEEIATRARRGEPVEIDNYLVRFPELAPHVQELRDELEVWLTSAADFTVEGFGPLFSIGRGGMGEVFRAYSPSRGHDVAIKVTRSDRPDLVARLEAEARFLWKRGGRGVPKFYASGQCAWGPYLEMEWIQGESLEFWAASQSPEAIADVVADIAEVVASLHTEGIWHCDLGPDNVLIRGGDRPAPVLIDFGAAKDAAGEPSQSSWTVVGKPGLSIPDPWFGVPYGPHTDVSGLGATLYTLLAKEPRIIVSGVVIPIRRAAPGLDGRLASICMKALAPDPRDRHSSAGELAEDLRAWVRGEYPPSLRWWTGRAAVRSLRRRPLRWVSAAALAVSVGAGAGYYPEYVKEARRAKLERTIHSQLESPLDDRKKADAIAGIEGLLELDRAAAFRGFKTFVRAVLDQHEVSDDDRDSVGGLAKRLVTDGHVSLGEVDAVMRPLREWLTEVDAVAPFAAVPPPFDGSGVRREPNGDLAPGRAGIVPLRGVPAQGAEVSVSFRCPDWRKASRIGLAAGGGRDGDFTFILRTADAGSFASALESGGYVIAEVHRRGTVVREHRWSASELPDGALELAASCQVDDVVFRIGNLAPALEVVDIHPLVTPPPSSGVGPKSGFGIEWPSAVGLQTLRVRRKPTPEGLGPLAKADALYNAGRFRDAADLYARQAETAGGPGVTTESRYKHALCLSRHGNERRAAQEFVRVARDGAHLPPGDPRRRWALLAAFQALRINHAYERLDLGDLGDLDDLLVGGRGHEPGYDSLATTLTESELHGYIQYAAPYAASTSPYHLLRDPDNRRRIDALRTAVGVLDRVDPSGASSAGPAQELLRICLADGRYEEACSVARSALGARSLLPDWRVTITRDAVWAFAEQAHRAGLGSAAAAEKLAEALSLVGEQLQDSTRPDRERPGCHPLVVERARLLAIQGLRREAADLLDTYLGSARTPTFQNGAGRFAPSESVPALVLLDAYLLQGLLHSLDHRECEARQVWREGFLRVRKMHAATYYEAAVLGSLAEVIDEDDAQAMIALTVRGANAKGEDRMVTKLSDLSGSRLKLSARVLKRAWSSKYGQDAARDLALRSMSFRNSLGVQVRLWAYEVFRLGVVGTAEPAPELSPDQKEVLWSIAGEMLEDYRAQRLGEWRLGILLAASQGFGADHDGWPIGGAGPLKLALKGFSWRAGFLFVLGSHFRENLNNSRVASQLLREAAEGAPMGSALRRIVEPQRDDRPLTL